MVKLSQLQPSEIQVIVLPIGKESVTVEVDTSVLTLGWQRRFQHVSDNNDISGIAQEFFAIVRKWDITDDDDVVLELNEDSIGSLTIKTFLGIVRGITDQLDPNDLAPTQS